MPAPTPSALQVSAMATLKKHLFVIFIFCPPLKALLHSKSAVREKPLRYA